MVIDKVLDNLWDIRYEGKKYLLLQSPYDNGGYRLKRDYDDATSILYSTPRRAVEALKKGNVTWEG